MTLLKLQKNLEHVKEQIEKKVMHPYLLRYINSPVIDMDKLLILLSVLDTRELSQENVQNYALTTMLIQIALDTHEQVSVGNDTELKNRQLTVLAGDYYSGLYYKLLADSEDIDVIRVLAKGIKNVNEHKIALYHSPGNGMDEVMENVRMIEFSLFKKLMDFLEIEDQHHFVSNFLFMKRLIQEKERFLLDENSIVLEAIRKITFPTGKQPLTIEQKFQILNICDHYIGYSKKWILQGIEKNPMINALLQVRLESLMNEFEATGKSYVEEG